jgi:hypothetical protein
MDMLSDLDADQIAELSDETFRESVQVEARTYMGDVLDTYHDVMTSSEDDVARVKAAKEISLLAGIQEDRQALPSGVSEEVFKLALAGLGQLAGIARTSSVSQQILRNVTPARADPRPMLEPAQDDSPMSRRPQPVDDNEAIVNLVAAERYEITQR